MTAQEDGLVRVWELPGTQFDIAFLDPPYESEELYLAALCRPPTTVESQGLLALVTRRGERRAGLEDVLWGVLNSKEFLLRR